MTRYLITGSVGSSQEPKYLLEFEENDKDAAIKLASSYAVDRRVSFLRVWTLDNEATNISWELSHTRASGAQGQEK